jgi:hypothetical protein
MSSVVSVLIPVLCISLFIACLVTYRLVYPDSHGHDSEAPTDHKTELDPHRAPPTASQTPLVAAEQPIQPPIPRELSLKHYPALRLISALLRIFGWLSIVVSALCFLTAFGLAGNSLRTTISDGTYSEFSPFFISVMSSIGMFFAMLGLWNLAVGESIKVFVDIALNTTALKMMAQERLT